MAFLKLLLAFSPWLAFMVIAPGSIFRLQLGLVVALVISVGLGLARIHRGVILWAGLIFFTFASIAVIGFQNTWVMRHMSVLANAMLASAAWLTVALRRPFTLDYARAHTDPQQWNDPSFIGTNFIITSFWAGTFTINALLAYAKMQALWLQPWAYEVINYALLIACALFTTWYPNYLRARQARLGSVA